MSCRCGINPEAFSGRNPVLRDLFRGNDLDVYRDSKSETRNLLESGEKDGSFQRPEERLGTLSAPLSNPTSAL